MPKMKTRKSAKKRYSLTASGKVKFKKIGLRHILTKKSRKRKRNLGQPGILCESEARRVRTMLPYG
ncbi:MAG: 50S ribosomal protein L35 [Spirochaetales bacterium]|jgi:large subunit ribosomal protein L35|nr:50S ribosomal protein L35 [Spirochaetales bacterium]